ncbi:hypothetical protein BCI9360_03613 [Bacillus sp. CECT 9360]|nr:hypothetical protein BCI9360_03613 [Bacillus sp. CECT 9360]
MKGNNNSLIITHALVLGHALDQDHTTLTTLTTLTILITTHVHVLITLGMDMVEVMAVVMAVDTEDMVVDMETTTMINCQGLLRQ